MAAYNLAPFGSSLLLNVLLVVITLWALLWKGFALWRSANKRKSVWFIALLIINSAGVLPLIYYIFLSKIDNYKKFIKVHDYLLILAFSSLLFAVILYKSAFIALAFAIVSFMFMVLFAISLIQESFERKEELWLKILLVVFSLISSVIYYFIKVRRKERKNF